MLNINQNFDLKAPVFNFDRDYFNSVDELNAYDTSNVPDHFVTNVAGMLYQFTDGKWLPMIGTIVSPESQKTYSVNLSNNNCYIFNDPENNKSIFTIGDISYAQIDTNGCIQLTDERDGEFPYIDIIKASVDIYKEIRIGQNTEQFGLTITDDTTGDIQILTDAILTEEERAGNYSQVDMSLTDGDYKANINARRGFIHKTEDGFTSHLDGEALDMRSQVGKGSINSQGISVYDENNNKVIHLQSFEKNSLAFGNDEKFKISRPLDNSEGATITGVKSITAFSDPSSTKVFATDGSIADLSTKANASDLDAKANTSDVLLKKSTSGGYYVEENSSELGWKAFAANDSCTASGSSSFAEGSNTKALSPYAHAEGYGTTANSSSTHAEGESTQATQPGAHAEGYYTLAKNVGSHAEGNYTVSNGYYSHAEGNYTEASGFCAHAQGTYNVADKNAIYSVGIGNTTTRKNAEYIYANSTENGGNLVDDPKNGYKYLIGVGGYDGISTDNTTYKSVQEVIADLTARIEQLETKVKALEDANAPA